MWRMYTDDRDATIHSSGTPATLTFDEQTAQISLISLAGSYMLQVLFRTLIYHRTISPTRLPLYFSNFTGLGRNPSYAQGAGGPALQFLPIDGSNSTFSAAAVVVGICGVGGPPQWTNSSQAPPPVVSPADECSPFSRSSSRAASLDSQRGSRANRPRNIGTRSEAGVPSTRSPIIRWIATMRGLGGGDGGDWRSSNSRGDIDKKGGRGLPVPRTTGALV
ncbi:hypothetical protein B0H16DRAFT_1791243 [Mycena metata]|uniref:Uncharacterized protein n=1 Tax=Mycena metata TaxID=1033252 RepID=A0AAD7JKH6_9AGAR|nr:hypothetical protein B0H16DRAFT_1791243 [Mycena metata]